MGGQACILYGGAEFSRDTDLAILADAENLSRLRQALDDLQAVSIAVPPLEARYLEMGLAVHFRCRAAGVENMRVDVMSKMRGVDEFAKLWERRTTLQYDDHSIDVLSLPDLVAAKQTQRDKDWPMIARLVEANYFAHRDQPTPQQIAFWLREFRTAALLIEVAARHPEDCQRELAARPLLSQAQSNDEATLQAALDAEEADQRQADREYWAPLKETLQQLRTAKRQK